MKILVLPDAHCHPDHDSDRFYALGDFIAKEQPDTILCLGDFADMPSLSSYDKGTKGFEGRRYSKDVRSAREGMAALLSGIDKVNAERVAQHRERYRPRRIMLLGNHEERVNRAVNHQAELEGTISIQDLGYEEAGWEVHPYKTCVEVAGFWASHCYFTRSGRELSSKNLASALLREGLSSAIVGHSHVKDSCVRTRKDGSKVLALSAGHYSHPQLALQGWAIGGSAEWWAGVVVLDDAEGGFADDRWISQERLMKGRF